jgi:hypothetical protein
MSDTPKLPDECKRLLDNRWMIVLLKSDLSDYTAMAIGRGSENEVRARKAINRAIKTVPENQLTGDFEPSQALTRLPQKVLGLGEPRMITHRFLSIAELPDDMADAFEAFKLSIMQHRLAGWREVSASDVVNALVVLQSLAAEAGETSSEATV